MTKVFVVAGVIGIFVGCTLGTWLVWQHDALVQFILVSPSYYVGRRGLLMPAVLGIVLGLAVSWCAESMSDQMGPHLWVPVTLSLVLAIAACAIVSYLATAALSVQVLGIVLLVFAVPVLATAAIRFKLSGVG